MEGLYFDCWKADGDILLPGADFKVNDDVTFTALADYGYYAQQNLSEQNKWTIGTDYADTTPTKSGKRYMVKFSGIKASRLTQEHTITAKEATTTV